MIKDKRELMVTLAVALISVLVVTGTVLTRAKPESGASVAAASNEVSSVAADDASDTPNDSDSVESSGVSADDSSAAPLPQPSYDFKDGTYSAKSNYATPEDTESITLTVTIKNDVITDTSANVSAISNESKEYATAFVKNYKPLIVGKDLSGIHLSRVSGSSLTSQGFNNAIAKIRSQARS